MVSRHLRLVWIFYPPATAKLTQKITITKLSEEVLAVSEEIMQEASNDLHDFLTNHMIR